MKRIIIDFETRSVCDLKKAGAYLYSIHPTTQPTCMGFKDPFHKEVHLLDFYKINRSWEDQETDFKRWWLSKIGYEYEFKAHNAFFDMCIYKNILVKRYGWPDIPFRQWRCTAAKAAACALPRSLEGVGTALNLPVQKDKRGYIAMMMTCRPTKAWNAWNKKGRQGAEPPQFLEPKDNPGVWDALYYYCKQDVLTEEAVDERLPDLIPFEQEIWFLNQQINWRGFTVDLSTVRKIVDILQSESKIRLKELDIMTMGLVTKAGARKSILDFLALEGIELPDIKAQTVEDVLKEGKLSKDMRRLLEIRKELSKTSTKKFQAFLNRSGRDRKVRDVLLYHGASTGRDSGTGIQPQNFPRGLIPISPEFPYATVQTIAKEEIGLLKLLYGENLSIVFSAVLRNMIMAAQGYELFAADLAKIEVAVLWWLADNEFGLTILRSGLDPYISQAAYNLGVTYGAVPKDGNDRQLGKAQILGCGFRMSWKKFRDTAWTMYRVKLTNKQSVEAVRNYRLAHSPVVELWGAYEDAAISAIEDPNGNYFAGKCTFRVENGFLWVTLPSGRKLAYFKPGIVWRAITYTALEEDAEGNEFEIEKVSRPKKTMSFLGLALNKKDLRTEFTHGGVLAENITQAVARDVMMAGLPELEKTGYQIRLLVHDEVVGERKKGEGSVKEFVDILCKHPKWAKGLPLTAKGWSGPRYRKA